MYITRTHGGMAKLSWPAWLTISYATYTNVVTYHSTDRIQHTVGQQATVLIYVNLDQHIRKLEISQGAKR